MRRLEGAEAILGADEHRCRRAGGERRLADTGDAVDQDARGGKRRRALELM